MQKTGYLEIPDSLKNAIIGDDIIYLGVEFYASNCDDIFSRPQTALFRWSDSKFSWKGNKYKDRIKSIPELSKFIDKTFNTLSLDIINVERGHESGSAFVFNNLIRGFRVAVRIISEKVPVEDTRLLWWGRVALSEDIDDKTVRINCTQEIGNFSYKIVTDEYGQSCPLHFGRGECLGTETLEQKSQLFQAAHANFGQGGCNRTEARCIQFNKPNEPDSQRRFFQGQKSIAISGQFIREEVVKKGFLFFKWKSKKRTSVSYSSKNQSDNDNEPIVWAFGRVKLLGRAFTWADIGSKIIALIGFCKGTVDSFYNITCHNPKLTIESVTQHLGELGGVGTQQPDGRFVQSGHNSKLAYCGITYAGSPPTDEPEESPTTSAVIRGSVIPVLNKFGVMEKKWSSNPVWIARFLITEFRYQIIRKEWFNEVANAETARQCFRVVEDDTNAEQVIITASEFNSYMAGKWQRYQSTSRYDSAKYRKEVLGETDITQTGQFVQFGDSVSLRLNPNDDADIQWYAPTSSPILQEPRTYLALEFTASGTIAQESSLLDALYGKLFPTFRGYLNFNEFGQVEILKRNAADNTFIRANTALASVVIPVASVVKFTSDKGLLLVGVGKKTAEIRKIKGIQYINGNFLTVVSIISTGGINVIHTGQFVQYGNSPSEFRMNLTGMPTQGEKITLTFSEPSGYELTWDYVIDSSTDTLGVVAEMFRVRLMASPAFEESWTAEIFDIKPSEIVIRCQAGNILIDKPLVYSHGIGEEILRVCEVYEDGMDETNQYGIKDNIKDFVLNSGVAQTYHGVTATYVSAVEDFGVKKISPRVVWDAVEEERNMSILELDLSFVDNYRQAAWLVKSATIQHIDGNLPCKFTTGILGMMHNFGDVVAVKYQTMEGISYTPFYVKNISFNSNNQATSLEFGLYLSAEFDRRIAQIEKFLDSTLTPNLNYEINPPPIRTDGGFSETRTGDGAGDRQNDIQYETQPYETLPKQQYYSPHGRDTL